MNILLTKLDLKKDKTILSRQLSIIETGIKASLAYNTVSCSKLLVMVFAAPSLDK
jgi:hypothetical protein